LAILFVFKLPDIAQLPISDARFSIPDPRPNKDSFSTLFVFIGISFSLSDGRACFIIKTGKLSEKRNFMKISFVRNLAGRELDFEKYKHVIGVEALVWDVAPRYGIDREAACLAAVAHDLAKSLSFPEQIRQVRERGLIEYDEDVAMPQILHGRLAAVRIRRQFGIVDQDILNAISYHTTGRPGMSPLEMLIYTADCVEPERNYPGVDKLREKLYHSLIDATVACMDASISHLESKGRPLHPLTCSARANLVRD
jgi:predicted HD superfamily hydrolase involved in NAD metabolism